MQYMGYYMYDAEATRLFYMIDTVRLPKFFSLSLLRRSRSLLRSSLV
jgi:hypothetical protein